MAKDPGRNVGQSSEVWEMELLGSTNGGSTEEVSRTVHVMPWTILATTMVARWNSMPVEHFPCRQRCLGRLASRGTDWSSQLFWWTGTRYDPTEFVCKTVAIHITKIIFTAKCIALYGSRTMSLSFHGQIKVLHENKFVFTIKSKSFHHWYQWKTKWFHWGMYVHLMSIASSC